MPTNVPAATFTDAGMVAPDETDVLAGFFADLQQAFGGALNPALSTPQGQLATSMTATRAAVDALLLLIINQVDPAYASGRMQDAIGRYYFMTRIPAVATSVSATVYGSANTLIPAASLAIATDGSIYQSAGAITIGQSGSATVTFTCTQLGPILCPAGTLNRIYRTVPGWDAITNTADGTLGRNVESRVDFETRRAASVAGNALGILPALRGAVLGVSNVLDAFVTENSTANPITVGGVTLTAHSLYVAVQGGADGDVARAIWSKKSPGCDYVGNTTITVEDQSSGYVPPYPTYNVTFTRPAALSVYFTVSLASSSAVPSNAATLVQNAIISAFAGTDGGSRVRIGTTVYASRFFSAVAALGSWAQIVSIHIGTSTTPMTGDSVPVQINQFPVTTAGNIGVLLL